MTAWRVWRWPLALGLLTASGLATALISDAWGDAWAALVLGLPVFVMARSAMPSAAAQRRELRSTSPEDRP